jgi:hypothetical protein
MLAAAGINGAVRSTGAGTTLAAADLDPFDLGADPDSDVSGAADVKRISATWSGKKA